MANHAKLDAGPAESRLRASIQANRRAMPRPLRIALVIGLSLALLQATLLGILALFDQSQALALVSFMALTLVSGREAALLVAFQANPPTSFLATTLTAVLGDLFALCMILPLVWLGLERLRTAYIWGGILLSIEKLAFEKKAMLRKYGLPGLALFVWLPGVGTGVMAAGAMGVISKMPLRQLLLALGASAIGVNLMWAILMKEAAGAIPAGGWWEAIPLLLILGMLTATAILSVKQRRRKHILPIERFGILDTDHVERLSAVGIQDGVDLLYVDCKRLAHNLGIPHGVLARCRSVSELCLLRTVTPQHAEKLTAVGLETVRDLSLAEPGLLTEALHERNPTPLSEGLAESWVLEAERFFADSEQAQGIAPS